MNCPICLNSSTRPAFSGTDTLFNASPKEFNLQECGVCECLFLNPMPDAAEIASFYPSQYWWDSARPGFLKYFESIYRRIVLRDHVRFIMTAVSRSGSTAPKKLLDVGCGSGTLIGILKKRGLSVTGIDMSEEASEIAGRENGLRVLVGTLDEADFENESFDVVAMFHVLEHVTNPRKVLEEARRILKPQGTLIVQVPNIASWQSRWFGASWYGLDIPRHVIDYSMQSITTLLEEAGFCVTRVRHFNLRDNAPALVSSLFLGLDPLSRRVRLHNRNVREAAVMSWAKHVVYFFLVVLAYPVTLLEAVAGRGATVMLESRKKL